jgi:uncharacterized protein (DUF1697 family)
MKADHIALFRGINVGGARAEKLLGVATTARNWNTVTRLLEMTRAR